MGKWMDFNTLNCVKPSCGVVANELRTALAAGASSTFFFYLSIFVFHKIFFKHFSSTNIEYSLIKTLQKICLFRKKKRKNEGKKKISSLSSTVQQTSYEWNILFNWKCILHSSRCFEPIPQRYFGVLCKVL